MPAKEPGEANKYPLTSPRFWHGMQSATWFSALARNRFNFSWSRLHLALGVSCFMPASDCMALSQHLLYGRAIAATKLAGPPLFVLGHWRSGTTLLHEMLALDSRYASPTTYECFAPAHFLLTESLVTRFGGWLLPAKRPMDNMKAGWTLPQEDEFALMNLGAPTPYLRMLFPCNDIPFENTLESNGFSDIELARWKFLMDWFLKAVTYRSGKPLVLKSPPHTGRLGLLKAMYPDAKFVHIVRDPRKLFPSTLKLWRSLDTVQGLQVGENEPRLRKFVFDSLRSMYRSFEEDRKSLSAEQLVEVKYEDLIRDPVEVVRGVYSGLCLPGFDLIEPQIQTKMLKEKEYKTNRFEKDAQEEKTILHEWHEYAVKYGYVS